jgi:pimeloyl-ACP methyl ester carboxylesterase
MSTKKTYDYKGEPVQHAKATVNGVRLHYMIAGSGEPLLLLHGVPKTSFFYHKLVPILSQHYTVVVPDVRGFGDSAKPALGYEMENIAKDCVELMEHLGFESFYLHGEDWGAAFAYAIAASYPKKVKKLSYCEMLLPGYGLEDWAYLNKENVNSNHWLWHIVFFHVPGFPEFLIAGKEREFWGTWSKGECNDPTALDDDVVDEIVRCSSGPEGLRPIFEVYRRTFENMEYTKRMSEKKLEMPVMAIGSKHFIAEEVHRQMQRVSDDVTCKILDCGHSLSLERPQELADMLLEFMKSHEVITN